MEPINSRQIVVNVECRHVKVRIEFQPDLHTAERDPCSARRGQSRNPCSPGRRSESRSQCFWIRRRITPCCKNIIPLKSHPRPLPRFDALPWARKAQERQTGGNESIMASSLRTLLPRSTRSLRLHTPKTTSFLSQPRRWQSAQPQQHPQSAPLEAPDAQNPKLTRIDVSPAKPERDRTI